MSTSRPCKRSGDGDERSRKRGKAEGGASDDDEALRTETQRRLRALESRAAVADCNARYARGLDRLDVEVLKSSMWSDCAWGKPSLGAHGSAEWVVRCFGNTDDIGLPGVKRVLCSSHFNGQTLFVFVDPKRIASETRARRVDTRASTSARVVAPHRHVSHDTQVRRVLAAPRERVRRDPRRRAHGPIRRRPRMPYS